MQLPAGINVLVDPWLVGKLTFGGLDMIYAGSKRVARPEVGSAPAEGSSSRQSSRGGAEGVGGMEPGHFLYVNLAGDYLSITHLGAGQSDNLSSHPDQALPGEAARQRETRPQG